MATSPSTLNEALVRDILRVLCRIQVSRGQLVLYRIAIDAPKTGFTSDEVKARLGIDQAKHRGLMSSLTKRVNHTPHETAYEQEPGQSLLFRQKWDGQQNTYWPHPELLEAIRLLPSLAALMERSLDDVKLSPELVLTLPDGVEANPPVTLQEKTLPPSLHETSTPMPPPMKAPFHALLADLDAAGLLFPAELVANLLLALQVKRFVILTGISGTGKTRIGQAIASRFRTTRRAFVAPDTDDRSAQIEVQPYMRRRSRMVLPAVLATQVDTEKGAGRLKARWPGGELKLATYRRTALVVLFKAALRTWFNATFSEGSTFVVRLEGPADEPPDTIVFEPPGPVREIPVENAEVVAVRADWTDHRGLLGHYNPLTQEYVATPFLHLLLRASEEHERAAAEKRPPAPFFALLDEMNLARVEHYFADFLSALESGEALHLHDVAEIEEGEREDGGPPIPRRLRVPPNLFFIGTVNVDESTHFFSPKVLDRAFAIEFDTVDLGGLASGGELAGELDLASWSGRLDPPARPERGDWKWLHQHQGGELATHVGAFHELLARYHRHFGYRVATEVARFVRLAVEQAADPEAAAWAALDLAVLQKVLVKLNGTQAELQELLQTLLSLALAGTDPSEELRDLARWRLDAVKGMVTAADETSDREPVFPRSAAKLWRMRDRLLRQGFTSWIE
jgi:hypothetical protein